MTSDVPAVHQATADLIESTEQSADARWQRLLTLAIGALLCAGFLTFTTVPGWSLRIAVIVLVMPLGLTLLVRLALARDTSAVCLVAALAWMALVSLFHPAPAVRILGMLGVDASLVIYAGAMACWAMGRFLDEEGRRLLPWAVICSLAVNGLFGLLQMIFDVSSGPFAIDHGRAHGLTTYSVYFGALMSCGVVMLTALPVPRRWWWPQAAGILGFAVASGLSGSRAALGAALLGTGFVAVRRRDALGGLAVAATLAGTAFASWISSTFVSDAADTATSNRVGSSLERLGNSGTGVSWRIDGWKAGLDAWLDHPLIGWGIGNFRQAVQGTSVGSEFPQIEPRFDAHNILIELVVALGLPGLILLCVFGVLCARSARGPLAIGAATLAITWLVQPSGVAPLCLGLLLLGAAMPIDHLRSGPPLPDQFARALTLVGLLGLAVVLALDMRLARAIDRPVPDEVQEAAAPYRWDPAVADLVAQAWTLDALAGLPTLTEEGNPESADRALRWSAKAISRQSDAPKWLDALALRQARFGLQEQALATLDRALALQPRRPETLRLIEVITRVAEENEAAE